MISKEVQEKFDDAFWHIKYMIAEGPTDSYPKMKDNAAIAQAAATLVLADMQVKENTENGSV